MSRNIYVNIYIYNITFYSHHQGKRLEEKKMTGGANHDQPTGNGDGATGEAAAAAGVREQDRFMPIANVIRIMRRALPAHAKVADDAKEMIQECVSEYISFITSEANDRCRREQRKTVTAEDLLWAMNKLGFDDYLQPLSLFLRRYRDLEGDHRGSLRGEPLHQLVIRHRSAHVPAAELHFFAQQQQNNYTSEVGGYGLGMFGNGEGPSTSGGNSTL